MVLHVTIVGWTLHRLVKFLILNLYLIIFYFGTYRLERAKKLQEQKEKELLEKHQQQQQEIVAGEELYLAMFIYSSGEN